jgi:hypothetical protein
MTTSPRHRRWRLCSGLTPWRLVLGPQPHELVAALRADGPDPLDEETEASASSRYGSVAVTKRLSWDSRALLILRGNVTVPPPVQDLPTPQRPERTFSRYLEPNQSRLLELCSERH